MSFFSWLGLKDKSNQQVNPPNLEVQKQTLTETQIMGDAGTLQQHEKEQPNYPATELLTIDTNLQNILGSAPLTNQGRIKVEDAIAPEQVVQGALGTQGAANQEVRINLSGQGTVALQLWGTWVGTVSFYGSIDGNNWVTMWGQSSGVGYVPAVSTTVATSIWRFNTAGLLAFKVQETAWTSGIARVILVATPIGALPTSILGASIYGSQLTLLLQRATSYELAVHDPETATTKDALQYPDPWNPKGYYYIGDTCAYNGQIYQCIVSHNAATALYVPTNTTYWQVDQRQNKSLITTQYISPPQAARVRVEIDLDEYQWGLEERVMFDQKVQIQNGLETNDYNLSVSQDDGTGGKYYGSNGSEGISHYLFEEAR